MTGRVPLDSELAAQVATLHAMVDALKSDIDKLKQRDAPPPVAWTALKAALPPGIPYETGRRWVARGYVTARKHGGRLLVDPESLRAVAASRRRGAA